MVVIFDSSVLVDLLNPRLSGDYRLKLDDLLASLKKQKAKILIPAPVVTEILTRAASASDQYLELMSSNYAFQIAPFDSKAAVECAFFLKDAFTKKEQGSVTKTKFKFDWQIIAIAAAVVVNKDVASSHAAFLNSSGIFRSGFSQTSLSNSQSRVVPVQRSGCRCFAAS